LLSTILTKTQFILTKKTRKMEKKLYADLSPLQREQAIEDNAYVKEEIQQKRFFTDAEMDEFRAYYCGLIEECEQVEEQLSELAHPLKEQMKKIKADAKVQFDKIRKKYEVVEITAFGFDNQEENTMDFYDVQGNFLHSRRLTPQERQFKIKAV
jgi:hypothetical protein